MTILQATKVSSAAQLAMPGVGEGQSLKCISSVYTLAAALALGDIIQSALIPAGALIVDVMVVVTDMDSSTGILLDVGYGVSANYFVAASATGQTGGVIRAAAATALPLLLTTNDTVDVKVNTAATGTAATTGSVAITVFFLPKNS